MVEAEDHILERIGILIKIIKLKFSIIIFIKNLNQNVKSKKMKSIQTIFISLFLVFSLLSCKTIEEQVKSRTLPEAEKYCNRQKGDKQKEAYTFLADRYFDKGDMVKAGKCYSKSNKLIEGHTMIAEHYMNKETYNQAYYHYTLAHKKEEGALKIAEKYIEKGNITEAEKYYKYANKTKEGNKRIGDYYCNKKQYSKAEKYYIKADAKNYGYHKIGDKYLESNMFFYAKKYYKKTNNIKLGYKKIANKYLEKNDISHAKIYYKKANTEKYGNYKIAINYLLNNNLDKAYEYFAKSDSLKVGVLKIADIQLEEKNFPQALKYYEIAGKKEKMEPTIRKEMFTWDWIGMVSTLYSENNILDSVSLCNEKLINKLQNINDGSYFNKNLPVKNSIYLSKTAVLSNSNNYNLKYTNFLTGRSFELFTSNNIYSNIVMIKNERKVAVSQDEIIYIYDIIYETKKKELKAHSTSITDLCYMPQNELIISTSYDKSIKLWKINDYSCLNTLVGHEKAVICVDFDKDEHFIATGSWDETIRIWELHKGDVISIIDTEAPVHDIAVSTDGKFIATISKTNELKIWNLRTKQLHKTITNKSQFTAIEASKNSNQLICGDAEGNIRILDFSKGTELRKFKAHNELIKAISIAPNSYYYITSAFDHKIKFWWLEDKEKAINKLKAELQ